MMRLFRFFLLAVIMAHASGAMGRSAAPAPLKFGCADFLSRLHIKPPHVLFIKCELDKGQQGKPLRAVYRVAGAHAAAVEAFFERVANLPHLKKSCCQWDSPPGQFTGDDGRTYMVYMMSAETDVKRRKQWRNIPSFEIVVETLTEDI
ncbi:MULTISPECIES: DUF4952 domain-containing protein [Methylomicrobium]|nr:MULTISPECIES: DUF4952 domain-containing protein [Methylomicrobium]